MSGARPSDEEEAQYRQQKALCDSYPRGGIDHPECIGLKDPQLTYDLIKQACGEDDALKTSPCQMFCGQPEADCDDIIQKYCDNLGDNAIKEPICGCFLKQSVYDNFFNSLSKNLSLSIPHFKTCYFPTCAGSNQSYLPFIDKQAGKEHCPSVCVIQNQLNNDGSINGSISFDDMNKCGWDGKSPIPPPIPPSPSPAPPSSNSGISIIDQIRARWNRLSRNEMIIVICVIVLLVVSVSFLLYKNLV